MNIQSQIREKLPLRDPNHFEEMALRIFRWQAEANPVYRQWIHELGINPMEVKNWLDIPHLPVSLFKKHRIVSGDGRAPLYFESSRTTGQTPSRHYVLDPDLYRESILESFQSFYGSPRDYYFFPLLPSYLEHGHASLVHMMNILMEESGQEEIRFYLNDEAELSQSIKQDHGDRKVFLMGVTFALLRFAQNYPEVPANSIIMETGGMKGRGPEMTRSEVHEILQEAFGVDRIHSEYGMTELLSQAYSPGKGLFYPPAGMRVSIRDVHDPFEIKGPGQSGVIRIADLSNLYSAAFIETGDLGKVYPDGSFEVLGRIDHSEVRGCNLMASL